MATVDKNFKVKNGLVVEGTTATVNGSDIITEDIITGGTQTNIAVTYDAQTKTVSFVAENGVADSTTDDLAEGTTNKYYTDARVDAYINASIDTDDVSEGTTNLYFTDQRAIDAVGGSATSANTPNTVVKRDGNGDFAAGTISANGYNVQNAGHIFEDSALIVQSNGGYPLIINGNQNVEVSSSNGDIILNADGQTYVTSSASGNEVATRGYVDQAESDANTFTTNAINALTTDDIEEGTTNLYFTNSRAQSAVASDISTAVSSHNTLTTGVHGVTGDVVGTSDSQILSNKTLGSGTQLSADLDANTYTITNLIAPTANQDAATKLYVDTKVADLVDGAPALLDTLNELAAAIADDPDFATTIVNGLGEKVAKAGDTMTGELILSGDPENALGAAPKQYVNQHMAMAISTANGYTDAAVATGNAGATPIYQALNVNDIAKQVAATVSALGSTSATAYTWAAADYRTAKFLVKVAYGTHTEVSEVLLTLDTNDNIAITEYAIVGTNGSLATISATTDGTDVDLIVTPGNDSTITVYGTLLV